MKTEESGIFIKYGISLWCLGFSLLLCLSIADEVKTGVDRQPGRHKSIVQEAGRNQNIELLKVML